MNAKIAAVTTREQVTPPTDPPPPPPIRILTSAEFVSGYEPPDYLVYGVLQRRFIYSFTGQTGHAKTAVLMYLAHCVGSGISIGGREVEPGNTLICAGENPDDVRQRWIAQSEHLNFNVLNSRVHFIPGRFDMETMKPVVEAEVKRIGGVSLIIVDTSAAFFPGEEDNSNVDQAKWARLLRTFTGLEGGPTVIVACHPIKAAQRENLLPRGGGAFLNEVDGNLTCWRDEDAVTVSWLGKFRGPQFDPLYFKLHSCTTERLKDSKGRAIYTVYACQDGEQSILKRASEKREHEDRVLFLMLDAKTPPSIRSVCQHLGFINQKTGHPQVTKANNVFRSLKNDGLVKNERGEQYVLTVKGKEIAQRLRKNRDMAGATYG